MTSSFPAPSGVLSRLVKQFSKFVAVGLLNTAIDFVLLNVMTIMTGVTQGFGLVILNTVSFTAATTNSYFFNKRWTFRDTRRDQEEKKFLQFLAISLVGAVMNGGVIFLVITFAKPALASLPLTDQLWVNVAKVFATGISLVWNFLGYKFIVFKR